MSLTITNTAGSLGDWLSLTPLLIARPNSTVIAKESPHTRQFARLYEGLAEVKFTDENIPHTLETDEELCFSQRVLNYYKVDNVNAIPKIFLRDDEIEWARKFLEQYQNPVVLNNTVGGASSSKPDSDLSNYRRWPDVLTKDIIAALKLDNHTILRFGTKTIQSNIYSNYDEFENVINIPDLNLRQLAACYSVIGKYVGTDTGDHHLMLAVGGKTELFVAPSAWHYNHKRHLYFPYAWKDEPIREIYHVFERKEETV